MKNDWLIEQKCKEGWRCDPDSGVVTRPDGSVHVKTSCPSNRYVRIEFWGTQNGRRVAKHIPWSRFVCWLAHGKPPHPSYVADHKDRDILNNHPSNLAWVSPSENCMNVSEETKEARREKMIRLVREQLAAPNGRFKLSYDLADEIRVKYHIEEQSIRSLAEEYDVSNRTISDVVHFRSWIRPDDDTTSPAVIHPAA